MDFKQQLITWRHYLHQHPETAFEEKTASSLVAKEMRTMGIDVTEGLGGTGVVGKLTCGNGKGAIGIRADMDALPIQEMGDSDHKSCNPGKMHGCGHDGHTTTLLGAAKLLSETKDFNGTVYFVFQPAEEPGKGAQAMIDDGLFEKFPMDEIYGMHNAPFLKAGKIQTRVGGMASSEDDFTFTITGKGGHASSPHEGNDSLACFAEIYLALQPPAARSGILHGSPDGRGPQRHSHPRRSPWGRPDHHESGPGPGRTAHEGHCGGRLRHEPRRLRIYLQPRI